MLPVMMPACCRCDRRDCPWLHAACPRLPQHRTCAQPMPYHPLRMPIASTPLRTPARALSPAHHLKLDVVQPMRGSAQRGQAAGTIFYAWIMAGFTSTGAQRVRSCARSSSALAALRPRSWQIGCKQHRPCAASWLCRPRPTSTRRVASFSRKCRTSRAALRSPLLPPLILLVLPRPPS